MNTSVTNAHPEWWARCGGPLTVAGFQWPLIILTACVGLAAPSPVRAAQYADKEDPNPSSLIEPVLEPGAASVQKPEGQYPYYGNAPDELLPYRNIVPYYRYWLTRLPFRGPGRDYPAPANLKTLKIGLLSPAPYGPEAVRGEMSKRGVVLALDEANAQRPAGELPFELIEKADSPQWGSAANIAVEFADNDILAFLGTIDGDATHVALRATLKLEIFMVNCSDPDPTLTETQIPWLLRVFPDNRQQGYRLAELIVRELGLGRIVVLRSNSRPGRVGVRPFVDAVRRLGRPILQEINFKEGDHSFVTQIAVTRQAEPDAVVLWGNPSETGPLAAGLRAAGVKAAFFGFDRLVDPQFVKLAGEAAEGATAAYFFDPNKIDALWTNFVARFQLRFGMKPDIYAGYSYDGAQMLLSAIRKAGPNRYRIHDAMTTIDEYRGVSGYMRFDGRWDNIAPIVLGQYQKGAWHFRPAPAPKVAAANVAAGVSPAVEPGVSPGGTTSTTVAEAPAGETPATAPANTNFVIGLLLPESEPQGRSLREGALLAIEQFNQKHHASARLIIRGAAGQWGTDGVEAARMVTDDGAQGLIAPPDGAASHLALQVSGRTAVPVVSLCGDSSVTRTGVPWMVRITPGTRDEARAIFNGLTPEVKRWIALVPAGRRGREIARDLSEAASDSAIALARTIEIQWQSMDLPALARGVLTNYPEGILLWLDPVAPTSVMKQLRTAGFKGRVAGPSWLADFAQANHENGETLLTASRIADPAAETRFADFKETFRARFGHETDNMAAMSYDAARLLLEVLRRAEGQPAHALFPIGFSFPGVTGDLSFDPQGNRKLSLELRDAGHAAAAQTIQVKR